MDRMLLDRVRECPSLPSLPTVALRILELSQAAEVDLADIGRVISKDPAMSGKILRTVNSSFYGNGHTVGTISQALVLLGTQAVRTLVVGFSLTGGLAKAKTTAFDRTTYWRRSIYSACAARTIAGKLQLPQQETCFLAALLMDLGMLALDQVLGAEYGGATSKVQSHHDLAGVEAQQLGVTHAEVSALLARMWKFPPVLQAPMEFHHQPQEVKEPVARKLTEVVMLAGRCADVFVDKNPVWAIADAKRLGQELFAVDEPACDQMLKEIADRTRELAPLFEIKIDPSVSYESVLARANEKLVQITKDAVVDRPAIERRRAPRIKRQSEVFILPCLGGVVRQSTKVMLVDVSARGIGILHDKPIEKGTQFIYQTRKPDGTPMTLLYEAVRCERSQTKGFHVGAELVCVLNDGGGKPAPRQHAPDAAEKISKAIVT